MNLQEENKALKERIAELEEQEKDEQGLPQEDDFYWYVDPTGRALIGEWEGFNIAKDMLEIGNIFQTKEQAEFAAEKLKVEGELRKFSRPFEYGKTNYHFFFDIDGNSFRTNFTSYCPLQGAIYFESEEKAKQAIESVGEERIKKYLFGVED